MALSGATVPRSGENLLTFNRQFYDTLWSKARLVSPEQFNTWPLIRPLLPHAARRLEVGPGLRPRLPIAGTFFVDISLPALSRLRVAGGLTAMGAAGALPFPDRAFDLICVFDIIEHLDCDEAAFAELARVARQGATLLLAAPLHPARWTKFDDAVGHYRRYEPDQLLFNLRQHGFVVARSAGFGMRPRSLLLARLGLWFLARGWQHAMWCYNAIMMPLAARLQAGLQLRDGFVSTDTMDDVLVVCRRTD
jgi:SAM-dependent methyltransferase